MLELRTFGGLDLLRGGEDRVEPVLRQSKGSALLAYLAVETLEGPVRRDSLTALLWPDGSAGNARNALRATLTRLRGSVGQGVIRGKGSESLWLDRSALRSDVSKFRGFREAERYSVAYRLYAGPFLDGFHLSEAAPFERWRDTVRRSLANQAYESALFAGEEWFEEEDLRAAEAAFRRALEIDRYREEALQGLLKVLACRDDRPAALRAYRRFRDRIEGELSLTPSEETRALLEEIRGPRLSIAVPPFRDLSPHGDQGHLSEGIAEDLLDGLARHGELEVAALSSSIPLAGADSSRVARELEVSHVLEGSVRRSDDRLRVSVRLVDAGENRCIWSRTFDRDLGDVITVQDQIASGVLGALEVKLLGDDVTGLRARDTDPEAYDLFLRGRHYWNRRYEVGLQTSLEFFEKALEKDPDFAPAHAAVAQIHAFLGGYGLLPPDLARQKTRAGARRAMALDSGLPASYMARGVSRFIEYDLVEAERDFLRAVEIEPGLARGHLWRGLMDTIRTGRWTETAERSAARALREAPRSPYICGGVGLMNLFARRPREGLSRFEEALELQPEFVLALYGRALAMSELGRHREGIPDLEKAASLTNDAGFISAFLGCVAGRAGDDTRAESILEHLHNQAAHRHVDPLLYAFVEAGIGRVDDARRHLDEALSIRSPGLSALGRLPLFEPLRDEEGELPFAFRQAGLTG